MLCFGDDITHSNYFKLTNSTGSVILDGLDSLEIIEEDALRSVAGTVRGNSVTVTSQSKSDAVREMKHLRAPYVCRHVRSTLMI